MTNLESDQVNLLEMNTGCMKLIPEILKPMISSFIEKQYLNAYERTKRSISDLYISAGISEPDERYFFGMKAHTAELLNIFNVLQLLEQNDDEIKNLNIVSNVTPRKDIAFDYLLKSRDLGPNMWRRGLLQLEAANWNLDRVNYSDASIASQQEHDDAIEFFDELTALFDESEQSNVMYSLNSPEDLESNEENNQTIIMKYWLRLSKNYGIGTSEESGKRSRFTIGGLIIDSARLKEDPYNYYNEFLEEVLAQNPLQ
jgi:hypothetical protein